ncbi:MAG: OmpH family outer membrane protein [Candidatus Omnitrophica bacterium]|nr:OmpH family outer membrane protein [Candidatus Omnitrophota bacterium]
MKKIALVFTVFLVFAMGLGFAVPCFAAGEKLGYVDLGRVFDEYQKTKNFDKSLEAKGAQKQTEREKMVAEVKKLRDEAELLSSKAKEDKQVVIDEKIKTLQEFDRATRDSLRRERDTMVREILKEIETVIQSFGKSQGYTFIFNDRVLVYKSEGSDLTQQVIKALNESRPSKK